MKILRSGVELVACWFVLAGPALAGENVSCPGAVHLASGEVVSEDVPGGFKPFISKSIVRLSGASVFEGPPERGAALKSDDLPLDENISKWTFEGATSNNVWLSCDYANGLIRLVKRVNGSVAMCTSIARRTEPTKNLAMKFICK